jgi:hypothetical protein
MYVKKNMKLFCKVWLLIFFILVSILSAQIVVLSKPEMIWSKKIDYEKKFKSSIYFDFKPTSDNGVIILGSIDTKQLLREIDIVLIKTNPIGEIIWSKTYPGKFEQGGKEVIEAKDHGFVICGFDKDQLLIIKTDSSGNMLWNKTFGKQDKTEKGISIIQTDDLGFLVLGSIYEDPTTNQYTTYIVKTDQDGTLEWTKTFGRILDGCCLIKADKEGYIFASGNSTIKISKSGKKVWTQEYKAFEFFKTPSLTLSSIAKTTDGYFLFGNAEHHGLYTSDEGDYGAYILIKTDFNGSESWQQLYDYPNVLGNYSVQLEPTNEGGTIFSDHKNFLVKTDLDGQVEWTKYINELNHTRVHQTLDAGYVVVGLDWVSNGYRAFLYYFEADYFRVNIESEYGKTTGSGYFNKDIETLFGVSPELYYLSDSKRAVFKGWISPSEKGYTGEENPVLLDIQDHVDEIADWETEYFIGFSSSTGGDVSIRSDWYKLGTKINIEAIPEPGYHFSGWRDIDSSKIISKSPELSIQINRSINLQGIFNLTFYTLSLQSQFGNTFGEGIYREGDIADFKVEPIIIDYGTGTRQVFLGWICNTTSNCDYEDNSANISMNENIMLKAMWKIQHYINTLVDNGGSINIESDWYDEGSLILIDVSVDPDYVFKGFYLSDKEEVLSIETSMPILVDEPMNIYAKLERKKKPIPGFPLSSVVIALFLIYGLFMRSHFFKKQD